MCLKGLDNKKAFDIDLSRPLGTIKSELKHTDRYKRIECCFLRTAVPSLCYLWLRSSSKIKGNKDYHCQQYQNAEIRDLSAHEKLLPYALSRLKICIYKEILTSVFVFLQPVVAVGVEVLANLPLTVSFGIIKLFFF